MTQGQKAPAAHIDMATFLAASLQRLREIEALEADWDTYGSPPPDARAIVEAHRLLRVVADRWAARLGDCARPSLIQPLPGGGVELTWGVPAYRLSVALGPDGAISYLLSDDRGPTPRYEDEDDVAWDDAVRRIGRFLEQ